MLIESKQSVLLTAVSFPGTNAAPGPEVLLYVIIETVSVCTECQSTYFFAETTPRTGIPAQSPDLLLVIDEWNNSRATINSVTLFIYYIPFE